MDDRGAAVRRGRAADADALVRLDALAAAGDGGRRADIEEWCAAGLVLVAEDAAGPVGYAVLEYSFFGQGFVALVMVAAAARRRGVGGLLLRAAEGACTAEKLFTSTNLSNTPMQGLLRRAGWQPVGMVDGLDEGDPELFYRCPPARCGAAADGDPAPA